MRKRMKMVCDETITFAMGCEKYLENCKLRNLREGTIRHYEQSFKQFKKYFDPEMPVSQITVNTYNGYLLYLKGRIENDVSINSYLRDLVTVFHFLMKEGYMERFEMQTIKVDKTGVETYTEEELQKLLKKPDIKKCSFIEYQSWVMTNFLFSTGVRQRSLMNIQIRDLDFDNRVVYVNVTKNRKSLIVPLNRTMVSILQEFLHYRQHQSKDSYLFCNVYGKQLVKATCYHMLYDYNKRRKVNSTGIHRYRHTFAKQWILNGGNVVTLSKILGHSNLAITQNYINLLVTDLSQEVDELNLLDKFSGKTRIKM